ncbi:MAG: acetate--CoA ligase family protein [Polyangia bacterium]|jgi:acetyltransferase|nr:acetate--CoA ligase family protein [Polyangia bacterium]
MRGFFEAETVAVVGVSERSDNLARAIVRNLHQFDFPGVVYLVGPRGGTAFGRRIYRSLEEVPDTLDLVVILTPARSVAAVLEECASRGVKRVIIETGGFGEFGEEGRSLESRLKEIAREHGIRFIGPNGIGAMNFHSGLVVPFTPLENVYRRGGISILAQSGGVGLGYMHLLAGENLGLSKVVSMGNKQDVDENDLLEFLLEDEKTEIVCLYLEGISDGRRLMEIARGARKPILLHKSNIGRMSARIAASHTAAMSGDDEVVSAALKQVGIVRFHDSETLLNYLKVLPLPRLRGRRLAVVSRSGGHAVIAVDACERSGFELAELPAPFLREVEKHFRAHVIQLANPLDLGDLFDLDIYARIARETLALPGVDALVFLHTYISRTEGLRSRQLFETLAALPEEFGKPVITCVATDPEELGRLRREYPMPVFADPQDAIEALALARDFQNEKERERPVIPAVDGDRAAVGAMLGRAIAEGRDPLLLEALEALRAYGIPVIQSALVQTEAEAVEIASALGAPVTLKVVSADISHKSDIGGVQLNLRTEGGVRQGWSDMMALIAKHAPGAKVHGVLVQPMAGPGFELIVGGRQDATFGPMVLVGVGGIFAEVFRDISRRIAPFTRAEAERMLEDLRVAPVLRGARGQRPRDLGAVTDVILALSKLLLDFPDIAEIDINPFRVFGAGEGGLALDGRILLGPKGA